MPLSGNTMRKALTQTSCYSPGLSAGLLFVPLAVRAAPATHEAEGRMSERVTLELIFAQGQRVLDEIREVRAEQREQRQRFGALEVK
jgi:hypothetical protein